MLSTTALFKLKSVGFWGLRVEVSSDAENAAGAANDDGNANDAGNASVAFVASDVIIADAVNTDGATCDVNADGANNVTGSRCFTVGFDIKIKSFVGYWAPQLVHAVDVLQTHSLAGKKMKI